jgi:hypothetical protein
MHFGCCNAAFSKKWRFRARKTANQRNVTGTGSAHLAARTVKIADLARQIGG